LEENSTDTTQLYVAWGFADLHSIKWLDAHGEALLANNDQKRLCDREQ
jgi:hypothetical protein